MSKLLKLSYLPLIAALAGCASPGGSDSADPSTLSAEQLYQQARRAADRGEYTSAVDKLETIQSQYPFEDYALQAQLEIINVNFRAEQMDAAIAAADRFIRLNPTHPRVDYAYYMRAWANARRGEDLLGRLFGIERALRDPEPLKQAYADFRRVAAQFPEGPYAEDARFRMQLLRNQIARHELAVAQYYLDRNAYVAAANRAKTIVQEYQDTKVVDEALTVLASAYDGLELGELRDEVRQVIERQRAGGASS